MLLRLIRPKFLFSLVLYFFRPNSYRMLQVMYIIPRYFFKPRISDIVYILTLFSRNILVHNQKTRGKPIHTHNINIDITRDFIR